MRKLWGFLVTLACTCLLCIFLGGEAAAAELPAFPMPGDFAPVPGGIFVINDRHELYYNQIHGKRVEKFLDNVQEVVSNEYHDLFILKTDGTVMAYQGSADAYGNKITYGSSKALASGIADISSSNGNILLLSNDGRLTAVYRCDSASASYWNNYVSEQVDTGVRCLSTPSSGADVYGYYIKGSALYYVRSSSKMINGNRIDGRRGQRSMTLPTSAAKALYDDGHTCFLLAENGTLWSWGDNSCGKAGNGGVITTIRYEDSIPDSATSVAPTCLCSSVRQILTNVSAVWNGPDAKYALKSDGTIWKWGDGAPATSPVTRSADGIHLGTFRMPSNFAGWSPHKISSVDSYRTEARLGIAYLIQPNGGLACNVETSGLQLVGWLSSGDPTIQNETPIVKEAVTWALKKGIATGFSDGTFRPSQICTRGQVVTFLWRFQNSPEPKALVNPFTDVSPASPFYKAILWAYENGITTGTSATTFSPSRTCTGAHVITFLWRAEGKPGSGSSSATSPYYAQALAWAEKKSLLSGTGYPFSVDAPSPRANIVTYLYRLYK